MRRLSLLGTATAAILVAFLLASTISYFGARSLMLSHTDARLTDELRARLSGSQGTIERFLKLGHREGIQKVVSGFGPENDLVIAFVTDAEGIVQASTRYQDVGRPWTSLGFDFDAAAAASASTLRSNEIVLNDAAELMTGYASICETTQPGALRAPRCGLFVQQIDLGYHRDIEVNSLYQQATMTATGFGLGALLLMVLLNRAISRRVRLIIARLERFTKGDRSARIGLQGSDELCIISNTTDRLLQELVEDEEALRASEQFNRAIIDSANTAVICVGTDGLVSFFSAGAQRMLGYTADEVVGRCSPAIFHDQEELRRRGEAFIRRFGIDRKPDMSVIGHAATLGIAPDADWTYVRKDGTRLTVHVSITALRASDGRVSGFVALARDVTVERGLAERLRLTEQVFESAGEAILVTDARLRIIDVNPAFLQATGRSREEVIGSRYRIVGENSGNTHTFRSIWREVLREGMWSGELWDRRKNGELFPQWLTISAIRDDLGRMVNYVGVFKDVTRQKAAEEELERMAYYDPLTNLPNRALLKDRLQHHIDIAARNGTEVALLFIDLDQFKYVNDTLGHDTGDRLLVQAASRIRCVIRQSDTLARLGGDEFTLIIADAQDSNGVAHVASKVIMALEEGFHIDDREVFIGASIGIGIYPKDGHDVATLIKNADTAMYLAKQAGRGNYQFFTGELNARNERRMALEASLRRAVENQEFELHYQPKIDMLTGRVIGFEALLRWQHPDLGMIPPNEFIPLAEETRLIVPIGQWVLSEACTQWCRWRELGYDDLRVSVNLSARQFQSDTIVKDIATLLARLEMPGNRLDLELTESLLMVDAERALAVMRHMRELGVTLSIDDFGMGYSSLSYLKKFPIDTLKIDREFVSGVVNDSEDAGIVRAIISLARTLQLQIIAEGVEEIAQEEFLLREGCELAQGFLYSRPLVASCVEEFLAQAPNGSQRAPLPGPAALQTVSGRYH